MPEYVNKLLPPFSAPDVQFGNEVLSRQVESNTTQIATTAATVETVVNPPAVTLPTTVTDTATLTYKLSMNNLNNGINAIAYDETGYYGYGVGAIVGFDGTYGNYLTVYNPSLTSTYRKYTEAVSLTEGSLYLLDSGMLINCTNSGQIYFRLPSAGSWSTLGAGLTNFNIYDLAGHRFWVRETSINSVGYFDKNNTSGMTTLGSLGLPANYEPLVSGNDWIATHDAAKNLWIKPANDNTNFINKGTYNSANFTMPSTGSDAKLYDIDKNGGVTYVAAVSGNHKLRRLNTSLVIDEINLNRTTAKFEYLTHKNLSDGSTLIAYGAKESEIIYGGRSNYILVIDRLVGTSVSNFYYNNTTLLSTSTTTGNVKCSKMMEIETLKPIMLVYSNGAPTPDAILKLSV